MEWQNKKIPEKTKMATRRRARDKEIPGENSNLSKRILSGAPDTVDVSQMTF